MEFYQEFKIKLEEFNKHLNELTAGNSLEETLGRLEPIKQAEIQANLAYFIQDLVYILLNVRGIDTSAHPIIQELNRIKLQFGKIKHSEQKQQSQQSIDKPAADRFIKAALQFQQKSTTSDNNLNNDSSNDKSNDNNNVSNVRTDKNKRSSDSHPTKPAKSKKSKKSSK